MDDSNLQTINSEDLAWQLRQLAQEDPETTLKQILKLEAHPRYHNDPSFKSAVVTQKITCYTLLGLHEELYTQLKPAIEIAKQSKSHELLIQTYLRVAKAYHDIELIDEALQTYMLAINLEKSLGKITNRTAIAYNNIGDMFSTANDEKTGLDYFMRGLAAVDPADPNRYQYHTLTVFLCSNIVINSLKLCKSDDVEKYLALAKKSLNEEISPAGPRIYQQALQAYACFKGEKDRVIELYYSIKQLVLANKTYPVFINILKDFYKMTQQLDINREIVIKEIIFAIEALGDRIDYEDMEDIYQAALDYYNDKGEIESANRLYQKMFTIIKLRNRNLHAQHLSSLNTRLDVETKNYYNQLIQQKNERLNRLHTESQKKSQQLNKMYERLKLITTIGKKLTATLDPREIEEYIYKELSKVLTMDTFVILLKDPAREVLTNSLSYEDNQEQDFYEIDATLQDSVLVNSFRNNKMLYTNNLHHDKRIKKLFYQNGGETIQSAIYYPISYDEEPIGVLSIQSRLKHAYSSSDIAFIDQLMPFLTIALNNASQSRKLHAEIHSHKLTQQKLTDVNLYLENLSNLDGLTKVNNRRAFENLSKELMTELSKQQRPVHFFMIDIDFFKYYNDTYGHLMGDQALIKVAKTLSKIFDDAQSIFARFGGEEFIAITGGLTERQVIEKATQIQQRIAQLQLENIKAPLGQLTISVGIATLMKCHTIYKSHLMKLADESLYEAKQNGRARSVFASLLIDDQKKD